MGRDDKKVDLTLASPFTNVILRPSFVIMSTAKNLVVAQDRRR